MDEQNWSIIIEPKGNKTLGNLKELFQYKDLIKMFIKRYFASMYKQTVLGPAWIVINPLITTLFFSFVFGSVAQLSTDGIPAFLFYMSGTSIWALFANTLNNISATFTNNRDVFGKVYFPRMTVPISTAVCSLINFGIQMILFVVSCIVCAILGLKINPTPYLLLTPIIVILIIMLGMGVGLIVTAMTTKYKDLNVLVSFAVQLWMYVTPVIYPVSSLGGITKIILMLNPMTPFLEIFRYSFSGEGNIEWGFFAASVVVTLVTLVIGIVLFNQKEKIFVDTI